jgi:hypothetical protein
MIGMLFLTLSISLFDSLSTTQQIVVFVLLLTTAKPIRNSLCYLAGLIGAYFACGLAGYQALDQLRILLARFFPSATNIPGPVYYQSEFIAGIVMTLLGIWYFRKKRQLRPGRAHNFILRKLQTMNGVVAFCIGVFISVSSFPVSLPYIAALGKFAMLHLKLQAAAGFILLYNVGYALPMLVVFAVYLAVRKNAEDINDSLHAKARMLNVHLVTWTFVGAGVFSIVDAGCFFTVGHALVKGRYF